MSVNKEDVFFGTSRSHCDERKFHAGFYTFSFEVLMLITCSVCQIFNCWKTISLHYGHWRQGDLYQPRVWSVLVFMLQRKVTSCLGLDLIGGAKQRCYELSEMPFLKICIKVLCKKTQPNKKTQNKKILLLLFECIYTDGYKLSFILLLKMAFSILLRECWGCVSVHINHCSLFLLWLNSFVFILWENSYCFDYKGNLEMDIFIFSKVVYICLDF